jgi:hypothetical protein
VPAARIARATRFACVFSSPRSAHRNGAKKKSRSIDMYGTIIAGTRGTRSSQAKYARPTSARPAVIELHVR